MSRPSADGRSRGYTRIRGGLKRLRYVVFFVMKLKMRSNRLRIIITRNGRTRVWATKASRPRQH